MNTSVSGVLYKLLIIGVRLLWGAGCSGVGWAALARGAAWWRRAPVVCKLAVRWCGRAGFAGVARLCFAHASAWWRGVVAGRGGGVPPSWRRSLWWRGGSRGVHVAFRGAAWARWLVGPLDDGNSVGTRTSRRANTPAVITRAVIALPPLVSSGLIIRRRKQKAAVRRHGQRPALKCDRPARPPYATSLRARPSSRP